jgi:hypothetical protein
MQISKSSETKVNPCILRVMADIPGGVLLMASSLKAGTTEIGAGTLIGEDSSNAGQYHVVKTAKLQADATNSATDYRVKKGHQFKVGNVLTTKDVTNCKAFAITAITTTEADYDTLSVGTTLGVAMTAANGVVFVEAAAEKTDGTAVPKYTPKAVTIDTVEIKSNGNHFVAAMIFGVVKESLLPFPVNSDLKSRLGVNVKFL